MTMMKKMMLHHVSGVGGGSVSLSLCLLLFCSVVACVSSAMEHAVEPAEVGVLDDEAEIGLGTGKKKKQHHCIHDSPDIQRGFHTGMDDVAPQPQGDRDMKEMAVGSMRIVIRTTDLTNGKYCTAASGTAPDFKGADTACTVTDDIFTTAKRDILINTILPAAVNKLSAALAITRHTGNIIVPGSCTAHTIPDADKSTGVANADFVLYVSAGKTTGSTSAWAGYCYLNGSPLGKGRPIVGRANFGPAKIEWDAANPNSADNIKQVNTAVHEIIHALGFSKEFIESKFDTTTNPTFEDKAALADLTHRGGIPARLLITPLVVAETKRYFGCSSATGAELEWGEWGGNQGSHWNRREFYQEVMNPVIGDSKLSRFTLSLLEDSGYYTPDYTKAETMLWGKGAGCGFVTEKCNSPSGGVGSYFCDTPFATDCTFDFTSVGHCTTINTYSDLPTYWQYLVNPQIAGAYMYMDHCPYVSGYSTMNCGSTTLIASSSELNFGFYFGAGGRCMRGSGDVRSPGSSSTRLIQHRCVRMRCLMGTQVQYKVGSSSTAGGESDWIDCPADGTEDTRNAPNVGGNQWHGTLTCPKASRVCTDDLYYDPTNTLTSTATPPGTQSKSQSYTSTPASNASGSKSHPFTQTESVPPTAAPTNVSDCTFAQLAGCALATFPATVISCLDGDPAVRATCDKTAFCSVASWQVVSTCFDLVPCYGLTYQGRPCSSIFDDCTVSDGADDATMDATLCVSEGPASTPAPVDPTNASTAGSTDAPGAGLRSGDGAGSDSSAPSLLGTFASSGSGAGSGSSVPVTLLTLLLIWFAAGMDL